jgi:hypothetical protein
VLVPEPLHSSVNTVNPLLNCSIRISDFLLRVLAFLLEIVSEPSKFRGIYLRLAIVEQ